MASRRIAFLISLAVVALALILAPAFAHGGEEVGPYVIVFGWREEPAFAGLMNGPEIFIRMHDESEFPADTAVELQAEVTFGSASTTIVFDPAFGETDHFIADLIPTMPGDYVFHVTGSIGEEAVDLTFDSAEGEFSTIEPASDIFFPPMPTADERIAALEARILALETKLAEMEGK
jgi:hypothetical protein